MTTGETIIAAVVFALSGVLFFLAARHFMQRGFLLNNAWIYASREERQAMDKGPYYRQSAVVLCLLGAVFGVIGLSVSLRDRRLYLAEAALVIAAVIYAVVSSARIAKKR